MAKHTALATAVKRPLNPDAWVNEKSKAKAKPARLVVEIPDTMHAQIKVKCAQERTKIKDVTQKLFQRWLDGRVQV